MVIIVTIGLFQRRKNFRRLRNIGVYTPAVSKIDWMRRQRMLLKS